MKVFGESAVSPHMSFAPLVDAKTAAALPSMVHLDSTARLQTVSKAANAWLHALLVSVGRLTGFPVLLNTSFNRKGRPIVNSIEDALTMLVRSFLFGRVQFASCKE